MQVRKVETNVDTSPQFRCPENLGTFHALPMYFEQYNYGVRSTSASYAAETHISDG